MTTCRAADVHEDGAVGTKADFKRGPGDSERIKVVDNGAADLKYLSGPREQKVEELCVTQHSMTVSGNRFPF